MKLQNLVSSSRSIIKKNDLSLERTYSLLNSLGNPHEKLQNVINVVGTNSKASMAYSLKAILNEAGYKCNISSENHFYNHTLNVLYLMIKKYLKMI